jgi:hypothetical protein
VTTSRQSRGKKPVTETKALQVKIFRGSIHLRSKKACSFEQAPFY